MTKARVEGWTVGFVAGLTLIGCVGEQVGASRVALEGETSTRASVVSIRAMTPSGSVDCSGVAIGETAIVTAAPCVIDSLASQIEVFPDGQGDGTGLEVSAVLVDPWEPPGGGGLYRLAVVHTASPHGVPVATRSSAPPAVDDAATAVGFGESDGTQYEFGVTRREAAVTVSALNGLPDETIPHFETLPPVVCSGDAGGGVFASDGSLLGVIQGGQDVCGVTPDPDTADNIIEVSAHADFLTEALAPRADGGVPEADGGGTDAGARMDAGSGMDAGTDSGSDGGCSAAPSGSGWFASAAVGLVMLGRRRRRRSAAHSGGGRRSATP